MHLARAALCFAAALLSLAAFTLSRCIYTRSVHRLAPAAPASPAAFAGSQHAAAQALIKEIV